MRVPFGGKAVKETQMSGKRILFRYSVLLIALLLLPWIMGCARIRDLATPLSTSALPGILEAMSPVVRGDGVPEAGAYNPDKPGPHRLVLLYTSGDPHPWNEMVPIERIPRSVSETELVVLLGQEREVELDTHSYVGGPPITRYAFEIDVEIREAQTGRILWTGILRGPVPPFPEQAPVQQIRLEGSHVGYDDLESVLLCRVAPRRGEICSLEGHIGAVYGVTFSPDGRILASDSGYGDGTVRMWRVSDSTLLHTLEGQRSPIFSPDGQFLATMALSDSAVHLWKVSDNTLLRTLDTHFTWTLGPVFSPDGHTLVAWESDYIYLWRVSDGALLRTLESDVPGNRDSVNHVAFSPDGKFLATASDDNVVRLWQVTNGNLVATLRGHTDRVWQVAFSPDGQTLASSSRDGVRLWQVPDGIPLRTLAGQYYMAFSPDGLSLVTRSSDYILQAWRASDGTLLHTLQTPHRSDCFTFSPDGTVLASAGSEGILTVGLWRVSDWVLLRTLKWGSADHVHDVAFSPDGQTLAVAGDFFDMPILGLWEIAGPTAPVTPTGVPTP